jgi:hypothetical protein
MKIIMMIAMTTLVAVHANARQTVAVYLQNGAVVPERTLRRAQGLASDMFAGLGIRIDWRIGRPNHEAITVGISEATRLDYHPGALAFAQPYEGVHITIFYDRIRRAYTPDVAPALLAHVLVHEIAHILQGIDRHSQNGVMKAHWTEGEIAQMPLKPLAFTQDDISLIENGVMARANAQPRAARDVTMSIAGFRSEEK